MENHSIANRLKSNRPLMASIIAALCFVVVIIVIAIIKTQQGSGGLSITYYDLYYGPSLSSEEANRDEVSIDIAGGHSYIVGENNIEPLKFTVQSINDGEVIIKTEKTWNGQQGSTNLFSEKDEFIITKDGPVELNSLTTDAGTTYILQLR